MSGCDLISHLTRLQKATRELEESWEATRREWHDDTSRSFAEQHLEQITPRLRLMFSAANELNEKLQTAARECGDDAGTDLV